MLAMLPAFAISLSPAVLVNALIQSTARLWFFVVTGTARSEPPRNPGSAAHAVKSPPYCGEGSSALHSSSTQRILPGVWLGIGYAPTTGASAGFPSFSSSA